MKYDLLAQFCPGKMATLCFMDGGMVSWQTHYGRWNADEMKNAVHLARMRCAARLLVVRALL